MDRDQSVSWVCRMDRDLNVEYVDVNEQNPDAVKFYERMGFRLMIRAIRFLF